VISYENILKVYTGLAKSALKTMDEISGSVIPKNLVHGRFVHFTADNIDILDSSLDGKDTFHATQIACWQRGPEADLFKDLRPSKAKSLKVPEMTEDVIQAIIVEGVAEPTMTSDTKIDWYDEASIQKPSIKKATATDMAFSATSKQRRKSAELDILR